MTFYKWSQIAAADATADASVNWQEGQAPSSINDSARAMMAAMAKILPRMIMRRRTLFGGTVLRCGRATRGVFGGVVRRVMPGGRCGMVRCGLVALIAANLDSVSLSLAFSQSFSQDLLLFPGCSDMQYPPH